jgi:hypothetical protein
MRKADSLRRWLTACVPEFKTHPDRLQIYLESGQVSARQSRTLSFVYQYTLKALVMDFAADADTLMIPLLAWIEKEQPQLLRRADSQPFAFEAELLDSETSDIEISIDLTEAVIVSPRADGSGYDTAHPPEPDFTDQFAGVTATFRQGFGEAEQLLESERPDLATPPTV